MDIKIIGELITRFKPYSIITDKSGEVLWISDKLKNELKYTIKNMRNVKSAFNVELEDILANNELRVSINEKSYYLTNILLKNQEYIMLILDLIGDYNDYKTRSFSLEKVIENLYDGVLLTDRQGKVVVYNRAMEELEKRDSADMIGKYIWDAYGYNDKSKSEHMEVFNSGIPIVNKYKAHAYNNGNPIYKSYSTYPIEINGETIGVYSISKNETKLQSLLAETIELKRQFKEQCADDNITKSNGTRFTFADIIGSSEVMRKLIKESQAISWLDNNILIVGDTGTGKEVFAQSIHNYGKRKSEHFIGINCSAIPENLLESILFGTVKGAYTGAVDSSGLFEEVGEGTLFLDELNSMPLNMQAKLLRVLQEKCVRRVGGRDVYTIKCRVISAMNEDPFMLIEQGRLRQDLFYRIAGYNLYIPPLSERGKDLFELAEYYISKNNLAMNKNVTSISHNLKILMGSYDWPGNIRELEHFIENIMVRTNDDDQYLRVRNIPSYILEVMKENSEGIDDINNSTNQALQEQLDSVEKKLILRALDNNLWNVTKSAEELGITRQSLIYRMRKLGVKRS